MSRTIVEPPRLHAALRQSTPLVQCLTNAVVSNFTANVLLAVGAAPAMVDIPGEAGTFARVAGAVLINLGTPREEQRVAMREAVSAASTPWVLDPVAIGVLSVRTALAEELLALRPTVIRGNASEIRALAGAGAGGRGVDAVDDVESAGGAAAALARRSGGIVAVSGAVDLITDGSSTVRVPGGDELLTRVTGGGCALGAVVAAFVATGRARGVDDLEAVATAHAVYSAAAERAAAAASGPGTFAARFLDELAVTGR
ncbi:hydroxyethylthiazole kinase [Leifsonia aquatica]|uniref:Hydroxyethylthiazole kinase n=2 Tax=Leifsonia aquatica TaxID=144185 RepID=U2SVK3_LEIAQ|nr:hydroxyethylthiazole kinase [Leifsonia aquatica]ERK69338.1 hydroxyethylthiazole kinase [Leifsonia aquatica ATCC 14665]MBB2967837.1 hydroxyethylthiazole kinase [Leifsonia aquatica]